MAIFANVHDAPLPIERDSVADGDAAFVMDEEEFRRFYERTARPVWAYLARTTGDPELADDLLQEAYYRFVRADATYESEAHRRNSLFRIATNLARDEGRRRRRASFVALADDPANPDPLDRRTRVNRAEHRTDLERALDKLKPAERELIWLAYGQGFSRDEMAETLGLKTGSVRLMLFRAKRKLAALLRGEPCTANGGSR